MPMSLQWFKALECHFSPRVCAQPSLWYSMVQGHLTVVNIQMCSIILASLVQWILNSPVFNFTRDWVLCSCLHAHMFSYFSILEQVSGTSQSLESTRAEETDKFNPNFLLSDWILWLVGYNFSRTVMSPTLWRAGHNPGHFSSRECQDSMCLLSATSTQGSTQPHQLCKVLTLPRACMKSMGLLWVWDIFCGGTKIPLDLVLAAQVGCGRISMAQDRSTRVICESIWKCCVRCSPRENWTSRIWMNIMSCLTGNFCSLLCYFCSGNCHCENHQVCYHDICNNYIPLSAVKWGRNVDWNPPVFMGLGPVTTHF